MKYWVVLFFLLAVWSCVPVPEEDQEDVIIDLANPEIQKIYSLQDRQNSDSLVLYFSRNSASQRYVAAMASGSIQSESALDELASLLFDPSIEVRTAAAYSLGQIGSPSSVPHLLDAFDSDPDEINSELNMTILAAVGKCGDKGMLDFMATTSTYQLMDDKLLLGQARGIYRYALRGITSNEGTSRMANMVINSAFPKEARIMAANYLFRARDIDLSIYKSQLLNVLAEDEEPKIRMCLAHVLGRIADEEIFNQLMPILKTETDYRVKVNALRGLQSFDEVFAVDSLFSFLEDSNPHVTLSALSAIRPNVDRRHTGTLRDLSNTVADSEIRAGLMSAALSSTPFSYTNTKRIISDQIELEYNRAGTDYKKSFFLEALSSDPVNYQDLISKARKSESTVLKTNAIAAMGNILNSKNFGNIFRTSDAQNRVKAEILDYVKERISSGDLGEIAVSGELLEAHSSVFADVFADSLFLVNEIRKLSGPQNMEAKKALSRALSALTNFEYTEDDPIISKQLNWATLKNISNAPLAIIVTTKGRITVRLMPQLAPATVANFINLTDENFYDRKHIHRVVPNFVAQGGCPRGDGYGSLDYTIRSELPDLHYDDEGYLGMASAGNHTESTQWFITHSPTPHLDGRYTIFGKVSEGMDVVHNLRIGDIIQDIRILKYN